MPVGYERPNRLPRLIPEKSIYHVRVIRLCGIIGRGRREVTDCLTLYSATAEFFRVTRYQFCISLCYVQFYRVARPLIYDFMSTRMISTAVSRHVS